MAKVLGIDYGHKRIGIALSDEGAQYAFAREAMDADGDAVFDKIKRLCQTENISTIVIGLPLNQDGVVGEAAEAVKAFAEKLENMLHIPVVYEDERFSTTMAAVLLRHAGKTTKDSRSVIDQNAAQIILQTYLDRHHADVSGR